jgi:predicted regulator of Ras-like GTPase activity (Roadblock/LC7/MglB family)
MDVLESDPANEEAWLWLAGVAATLEDARVYLETVLALNPQHKKARQGLRWLNKQLGEEEPVEREAPTAPAEPVRATREEPEPAATPQRETAVPTETLSVEVPSTPGGFSLSVAQAEAIDECLDRIAYESEARCIILADVTGQLIAERGQMSGMNTQVLSALAAGELAATQEMARLVGERARFRLLLHEGESHSVYLSDVGAKLLIVIVFDSSTPIGLVRILLKKAIDDLAPVLAEPGPGSGGAQVDAALDGDFAQMLEDELNTSLEFGFE